MKKLLIIIIAIGMLLISISPIHAYYTNMPASVVIGQPDFNSNNANQGGSPAANTLNNTGRALVMGGKLVVADGANNRVLIFNQIPTTNNASADVVIGQQDFISNSINQGGSVAANTINNPNDIATDGTKLLIADGNNRRILIFNQIPTTNNASADVVIGQPDMITNTTGTTAAKFSTVNGLDYDPATGKLLITESSNSRALIYNSIPTTNGASANVVIGQADFTHGSANQGGSAAANTLNSPREGRMTGGKIFIADFSNNRVLIWNTIPTGNNASADVVIGQTNFTNNSANQGDGVIANTLSAPLDAFLSSNQRLFVADVFNSRILIFNKVPTTNNASADAVIGQADFVSSGTGISANTLSNVGRLSINGNKLFAKDNNRILIYYDTTGPGGSVSTPVLSITTPLTSLSGGRLRMTGNVIIGDRGTSAIQSVQASINGLGFVNVTNLSSGRDLGTTQTIYDFTEDFDPTTGSVNGSSTNYTVKLQASDYNNDLNYLFYFQPFKFNSFNVASSKSQSFSFTVNKDQLQRVKDNIDHFEVWYKANTSTGSWTNYISNIPDTQIDQNGLVIATKTSNLTKFIGSYSFKIIAVDNWGNRQDSNTLTTAGTSFILPTPYPTFIKSFIPLPTSTAFPTSSPIAPTGTPIPSLLPSISLPALPNMGIISSFKLPNITIRAIAQAGSLIILLGLLPIAAAITIISNLATTGIGGNAITRSLQALGILPMGATEGIVYSSVTNKPVPFAVITIKNEVKGSGIYETLVTDSHGLYGSVKLTPGIYRATVRHQDYSFPTLATRPLGLTIHDFYKGDAFPVTSQKENNFLVIPVDPLSTEAQKGVFRPVLQALNNISQVLFIPAGIFSAFVFIGNMNIFNGIILGIYSGILLFKGTELLKFPTFKGSVIDKDGEPIPDALIRLTDASGKIIEVTQSDKNGRYNLYSKRGVYNLYATRLNYIDPKTNITQIDTRKMPSTTTQLLKWSN